MTNSTEEPVSMTCTLCLWIGTEIGSTGQCPRCHWDELVPTKVATEKPKDSHAFIMKTNEDYAAWCRTFYVPESLNAQGHRSLDGLWAWQEQERRRNKEQK